jgi:hypothetical protein
MLRHSQAGLNDASALLQTNDSLGGATRPQGLGLVYASKNSPELCALGLLNGKIVAGSDNSTKGKKS